MKARFALLLAVALLFAPVVVIAHGSDATADEVSTPVITEHGTAVYGETMPLGRPIDIGSALSDAQTWEGRRTKFEGRITSVCQNKGCWLILTEGSHYARVFSGHTFFLPKDTTGNAVVYGTLSQRTISEEFAKHLAEDSGQDPDAVVGEQIEYRIDASSVEILPAS